MSFPSAPRLTTIIYMAVCVGLFSAWPSISVTANEGCVQDEINAQSANVAENASQPCEQNETSHNDAFSLMLPFVFSNGTEGENPTPQPTLQPGDVTATPTSTLRPTPTAVTTTSPTTSLPPTATPTTAPSTGQVLFDPPDISALTHESNSISLSWTGCDEGTTYRVLYSQRGTRPSAIDTTERSVVIPNVNAAGQYDVMVECYDELGNSVFSAPRQMEVTQ